jgi:hypothetical protein
MSFGLFISLSLISLLFIFGLVFILIPLRIKLRYFYQGENSYFWLEIKLWPGIRVYRRLFLKNKFKGEGKKKRPESHKQTVGDMSVENHRIGGSSFPDGAGRQQIEP